MTTFINKELEKEFFDTLDEKLDRAGIAFKAYEKGYADAMSIIKDIRAEIQYEADNKATPMDMIVYYRCLQIISKHMKGDQRSE